MPWTPPKTRSDSPRRSSRPEHAGGRGKGKHAYAEHKRHRHGDSKPYADRDTRSERAPRGERPERRAHAYPDPRRGRGVVDLSETAITVLDEADQMADMGFLPQVREMPGASTVSAGDESGMTLRGFLLFADPAKPDARASVDELHRLGVSVRLITGDNRLAAQHIARDVGLASEQILTGSDIAGLDDAALKQRAAGIEVFAEIEPLQKERIVRAIRASGQTVGYLGDGINDAAALKAADVGISVDSAVDVAKNAAAIVLLDKSLAVIGDGIRMGRATFVNTLKYIRVTASANLGNVISMAVAAVVLPFLPLLPRQILLLNFVSDIPGTMIATDNVDEELLDAPRRWDVRGIARFMLVFGLASTLIDLTTFAVLRIGFDADADLFRSSWFVVSMMTELTAMLVLRTARPSWRSRPSRPLLLSSVVVAVLTVALPYSPLAAPLGLVAVPAALLAGLAGLTVLYVLVNEALKRWTPFARM